MKYFFLFLVCAGGVFAQSALTITGSNRSSEKETRAGIRNSELFELEGVGHIPHIQAPDKFEKAVMDFLRLKISEIFANRN